MRITTWNCNGGFTRKTGAVTALTPDILVVPECGETATAQPDLGQASPTGFEWVGQIPTKGLGVFSFGEYSISRCPFYNPDHRFVLPLEVSGPMSFLLLAVWTLPDAGRSYVRPLVDAWKEYEPHFSGREVLMAGDFNASVAFPGKPEHHFSAFLNLAGGREIHSLYHERSGEDHGKEIAPTFFMHRKKEKPFHIDYMFASPGMRSRLQAFEVGSHEVWRDLSDHVPITASFGVAD